MFKSYLIVHLKIGGGGKGGVHSVIGDLPSSGCLKVVKDAQFLATDLDHGTGLALLAHLGCQGFSDIVPNGPTSSHSGSFSTRLGLNCKHVSSIPI